MGDDLTGLGAAGHGERQADPRVRVVRQEREGATADGFGQGLRAQIGGADRVRLVDDRRTTSLVASHGQRESEGQDEPDDTEQGGLQDSERLAEIVLEVAERSTEDHAERGRSEHHGEQDEPERPTVEAEEHRATIDAGGRAGIP